MKINLTETVLRDGNQSLMATRLPYSEFEDILPKIDECGYYSVECWGGATFDCCMRYLSEDPWERLRNLRKKLPKSKLQMLLRGQNILGYKPYPDDPRNLKVAMEETVKRGGIASGAISYTTSPVHTLDAFVKLGREMKEMGASTICIKDMAGIMGPKEGYDLVSALKDKLDMPIILHTHCTTGVAFPTALKCAEAGVDVIDTAVSCFSGGSSQPSTETMAYVLRQLGFEVGVDTKKVKEVNDFFVPIRNKYLDNGTLDPKIMGTDADALAYQVPGGMISNLLAQLKAQKADDKFYDVLAEVPAVRKDLGYPPLVTPTSQIVGVQAVQNVLAGERYKNVSKEVKSYLAGEYGRAPGKVNEELRKKIVGDNFSDERYADKLEPAFEKTKAEIGDMAKSDEDVLSYIAFPQVAEKFFAERKAKEENIVKYSIVEA